MECQGAFFINMLKGEAIIPPVLGVTPNLTLFHARVLTLSLKMVLKLESKGVGAGAVSDILSKRTTLLFEILNSRII